MKTNVDILVSVATKSGATLRNLPLAAFNAVLASAALCVDAGRVLSEREINAALLDWLEHEGAFARTDHVELRRILVDCGLLERDGFGRAYRRREPTPEFAAIFRELEGFDVRGAVARTRAEAARARSERAARRRTATPALRSGA